MIFQAKLSRLIKISLHALIDNLESEGKVLCELSHFDYVQQRLTPKINQMTLDPPPRDQDSQVTP